VELEIGEEEFAASVKEAQKDSTKGLVTINSVNPDFAYFDKA
jgi:hypothetical protein